MLLSYLKALHFIGFVTWFAGLFYLVRLFIYHVEAFQKPATDRAILARQFALMERRLFYIITWPGMVLTLTCGIWMILKEPRYLDTWLHIKLGFVGLLVIYHFVCGTILNSLKKETCKWTSKRLRLWNELATLILVAVIFIAVLKNTMDWIYGLAGFIGFGLLLFAGIVVYRWVSKP